MSNDILTTGIKGTLAGNVFEASLAGKSAPRKLLESVLAYSASAIGGHSASSTAALPESLTVFVNKVIRESYKVVDRDFETLNAAGYSDEDIIDITLAASSGAAMARMQIGLTALGREA